MTGRFIPFNRPQIEEEEIRAAVETLRSRWLTTGPRAEEFERDFARYVGARHAIAVSSGTAALQLALVTAGVSAGDEVITTPFTFTATAEVIVHCGARPVFVDVRPEDALMDPARVEASLTPRTKAILPVHYAGQPCDVERLGAVAAASRLVLVDDAAHALPARVGGRMVGTLGDLTAFSFYATKTITTGEGGMVTTAKEEYAERIRALRLHGLSRDAWTRHDADESWQYEVHEPGYKCNMMDLLAAIGIEQLKKCDAFHAARCRCASAYTAAFSRMEAIIPPREAAGRQNAWHLYVILIRPEMLTIDRGQFVRQLRARNIGASVHFIPLHLQPYYRKAFGYAPGDFPNAEWFYERCISLPIYPGMTQDDVLSVIEAVADLSRRFRR
ncbi:MAG: DegT/DnrJ/EryC1/StrS aminotransferase family protein [Candidatus Rokubacteria bacterium]|nr:DegT/DnrJ/EryC1/StrS aminotransferase family protein [Candidatus Rokubacteria bacterium]